EPLGAEAVPEDDAAGQDRQRPAGEEEVGEESGKAETERPEIVAEKKNREEGDRQEADHQTDEAHQNERADQLDPRQRADEEVRHVARPHLFQERDVEAELAADQHVPEQDAADEDAAGGYDHPRLAVEV